MSLACRIGHRMTVAHGVPRGFGRILLAAVCLACSLGSAALPAAASTATLAQLHLWKVLPSRTYVSLGGRTGRDERWEAFIYRTRRAARSRTLCLEIVAVRKLHGGGFATTTSSPECGSIDRQSRSPVVTQLGMRRARRSVIVVATGTSASRLSIAVTPSGTIRSPFEGVGGVRAKRLGIDQFRYAVVVGRGDVCIDQIKGELSDGSLVFATRRIPCSPGPRNAVGSGT